MNDNGSRRETTLYEAGGLGVDSLFVRFGFTRDEFASAVARWQEGVRSGSGVEKPAEIKTYIHELTHYIQYSTTPYGLFLHHCRVLQNRATIEIIQALLAARGGFDMPLLQNVPELSGETEAIVQRGLSLWLNVEDLVASLAADSERRCLLATIFTADSKRVEAGLRPRMPPLLGFRETFARVQSSLADLFATLNQAAQQRGNAVPMVCPVPDADLQALQTELAEATGLLPDLDRADLRTHDALDLLGNPWSVEAVIESAAAAAEFYGSDLSYDQFVAWAEEPVDPRLRVYRNCIAQALPSIQSREIAIVIPTYIALCELALSAPLLPQHAALRRNMPDFRQILPSHRWTELLRVATKVRPMNGRTDHGRFVTDLCRSLDWVHPLQIAKAAVDGPPMVSAPLSQIYNWAQRVRALRSGSFIGLDRFLLDNSPEALEWLDRFNFVIIDYADRTTYHRNKNFLQTMTTRHLEMLGLRCVMEGRKLVIQAPYRGNEMERQWMTAWLQERFKTLFNQDFPMLRITAAQ